MSVLGLLLQTGGGEGGGVPLGGDPTGGVEEIVPLATPGVDWTALVPLLILGVGALLLLTVDSLWRGRKPAGLYTIWTIAVAAGAGIATTPLWDRVLDDGPFTTLGGAVGVDGFSLLLIDIIAGTVILAALFADDYLRREGLEGPSLYVLMLLSAAGGVIMAGADDLIVLFLGLETLSIAAYVLAALHVKRIQSLEAGMKYFVLGAFSSGFFLYGIAMVYGATGSTNLIDINAFLAENVLLSNGLLLLGLALMLVGLGFKVAAVPFHTWAPDVYDGAPGPVVAYMASGIKAAGFAALIRVFSLTFLEYQADWQPMLYALAILTLFTGSVLAVVQSNVKRMLAYSSIAHAGFMLVGVQVATQEGISSVVFYLGSYAFLVAGSFGVVTLVDRRGDNAHDLDDYRGLGRSSPLLAFTFTVLLLAQAGVPFTSGFFAKFFVVIAAVEASSYWLALAAMVSAVIAAYLYLRIVVAMWMTTDREGLPVEGPRIRVPFAAGVALFLCLAATITVGVWPEEAVEWSDKGVPALVRYETEPAPAAGGIPGVPGGGAPAPGGGVPGGGAPAPGGP